MAVRANKKEEKGKTLFLKVKSAEWYSMRLRIEPTIIMFWVNHGNRLANIAVLFETRVQEEIMCFLADNVSSGSGKSETLKVWLQWRHFYRRRNIHYKYGGGGAQ